MDSHVNWCIYIWNQISINLYLCTALSVGLYIVMFLFKCALCLTVKAEMRPFALFKCCTVHIWKCTLIYCV